MSNWQKIFGRIHWQPPEWPGQDRAGRSLRTVFASAVVAAAVAAGIAYYQSLPKPAAVTARVMPPGMTPVIDGELRPKPLRLDFWVRPDAKSPLRAVTSIARIDKVGEILEAGVDLEPAIPGEWRWLNENRLQFMPAEDWPAGQRYTVQYDPSIFAPNLNFDELSAEFDTAAFDATIDALDFYQDPIDRNLRKVVATLSFTHPVDEQSLRQHLRYTMRPSGATITGDAQSVDYDVRFDSLRRRAYIHSTPIDIPPEENYMTLHVAKGLAPAAGPSTLQDELLRNVLIPDAQSFFRISHVQGIIARNEDDEPVQTITIQFTDRVNRGQLREKISAWLLPEHPAVNGVPQPDRLWQSPREVDSGVLAGSERLSLELLESVEDAASIHSATVSVPGGRSVYLRIESGLRSDSAFELSRSYDTVFRMPSYPKEVRIAQSGGLLPLTGSKRLTFISRGVPALRVEIARLLDRNINHLASQTGGEFSSPYFVNYRFNEDNLSARTTRYIDVSNEQPGNPAYSSLDLSEFLPDGGYYFVTVQGWDRESDRPLGNSDKRFVLVTDLGLLAKSNLDGSHDVFIHSIASGEPVPGATVKLLGKNGEAIARRTSSTDGHAVFPDTSGFTHEQQPTVFVVTHGRDSVFMPFARRNTMLQYSRYDTGGQFQTDTGAQQVRAQVFSDRGIYRPGDTVRLGSIVKRDDWQSVGRIPLMLRIVDPRGQVALNRRVQLPDAGLLDESFTTQTGVATGNYTATLFLVSEQNSQRPIGHTTFRVEEFLPDRLRINSTLSGQKPAGWLSPEALTCEVRLENLFGAPAQSRRVTAEYSLTPATLRFARFKGFTFDDPLRNPDTVLRPVQGTLIDATTDQNGLATLPLNLDRYDKGIYRLTVSTEGFEAGDGRSVRAQTSAMISPLDHLVGHRTDSDLSFLQRDTEHSVEFIAVNSDGEQIGLDGLTLSVVEFRYVSSLVQRPDGTYAYESVKKAVPVSRSPFEIEPAGVEYALPTSEGGRYALHITDEHGLMFSRVDFVVAGAKNLAATLEKNTELDIRLNGSEFIPGDEIELEITAPFSGAGLITIERERVYAHKWISADSTSSIHRIRVPEGIEGNAYINVAFVRDLASPEIYVSPLSYAAVPFSIDKRARTVDIELDAPALVRPGTRIEIGHKTSIPADVILYAVDEGILQVANYRVPDPVSFFLPKMALQVDTWQLVDQILPDFAAFRRTAAPGGGEAAGLAGRNLNPFRRRTDAPVAFWAGIVPSGPGGGAVSFGVPDYFNGQLRIMAVAAADTAVGHNQVTALVRAPFVITPNVPTTAAPGDEFEINVGIANNLDDSGPAATVALSVVPSEHLSIVGEDSTLLTIGEGSEGAAKFRVRALGKPGAANLAFTASSAGEEARMNATISVRPAVAFVASMQSGRSEDRRVTVDLTRDLHPAFASQSAAASASPLILADGLIDYLDAFPHGCVEQTVSKVFPKLGFLGHRDDTVDEATIREQFANTITRLRSRQGPEGGFRFWSSSPEAADFPSVYVLHFLTDAAEKGLPVPRDMLSAGMAFLESLAARQVTTLSESRLRAYAIYVLTRNSVVTTNYLTNLHETLERDHGEHWRSDLTASYMAAAYTLLREERLGETLIADYKLQRGNEYFSDFDTRLGRDAQYLYLLSKHFPQRVHDTGTDAVNALTTAIMRNRFNTLSSAYSILALDAFTRANAAQGGDGAIRISVHRQNGSELLNEDTTTVRANVPTDARTIEFEHESGQHLFYMLSQSGFDRTPPESAVAEGIEVHREYLDRNGNEVTNVTIGDELTVRLRIRSLGPRRDNVAVVDLLPGGFEALSESVARRYGGWAADYVDVREDRLVVYGSFGSRLTEIRYRVKATSAGEFTVPPVFAGSMYDPSIHAHTAASRIEIRAR